MSVVVPFRRPVQHHRCDTCQIPLQQPEIPWGRCEQCWRYMALGEALARFRDPGPGPGPGGDAA